MRFNASHKLALAGLLFASIVGFIVATLALEGHGAANNPLGQAKNSMIESVGTTITNVLDIPLYPNAHDVQGASINDDAHRYMDTSFQVTATREEVFSFYEKTLPLKGWAADSRDIFGVSPTEHRDFTWFDSSGASPYALTLTIYVDSLAKGSSKVEIDRDKWPDIYNTPLYPDARNVQIGDVPFSDLYPDIRVITTTYMTSADATKIQEYYKTVMIGIGWRYDPYSTMLPESPSSIPSLEFRYTGGGVRPHVWGGIVTIIIRPHSGNPTDVEIRAQGFDVGFRKK